MDSPNKDNEECMDVYIKKYIDSLDEKEKIAYNIAINHLESSFNIEKSIGFIKWLEKNK